MSITRKRELAAGWRRFWWDDPARRQKRSVASRTGRRCLEERHKDGRRQHQRPEQRHQHSGELVLGSLQLAPARICPGPVHRARTVIASVSAGTDDVGGSRRNRKDRRPGHYENVHREPRGTQRDQDRAEHRHVRFSLAAGPSPGQVEEDTRRPMVVRSVASGAEHPTGPAV